MVVMKNFAPYIPDVNPYAEAGMTIAFCRDSEGRDWYDSQALFAADTLKVCYHDNGVIVQYAYDASALTPVGLSVAEVSDFSLDAGINLIDSTWIFNGESIVKRTFTAEELQQKAEQQRQALIASASDTISLWQSELLLGSITDDDKASLIKWMAYIKAVKALDFTGITDQAGFNAIVWPVEPA